MNCLGCVEYIDAWERACSGESAQAECVEERLMGFPICDHEVTFDDVWEWLNDDSQYLKE